MAKVALGIVLGFLLAVGVLIAGRHFFSMTIPFKQESLGLGAHSHMKVFVAGSAPLLLTGWRLPKGLDAG
jgi:hypothetical protein